LVQRRFLLTLFALALPRPRERPLSPDVADKNSRLGTP
jgi:hypothetical protein